MAAKVPDQQEEGIPLSRKAKVHYGRLYQIHDWMSVEERTRVRTRQHLFNAVNKLRPGYFNHQAELMDDTTVKYLPCRDFQTGSCNQKPIHYFHKKKVNGKKSAIQVIHGCDLCYYGRWDLGFHTINNCHLKHLVPKGTGETPWDRRDRKKKEEKCQTRPKTPPAKRKQDTITIDESSTSDSSSSSSSSDDDQQSDEPQPSTSKCKKAKKPVKKKKKKSKKSSRIKHFNAQLKQLTEQVAAQNKIMLQHGLQSTSDAKRMEVERTVEPLPEGLSETADPVLSGNQPSLDDLSDPVIHEPLNDDPFGPQGPNRNLAELGMELEACENEMQNMEENTFQ